MAKRGSSIEKERGKTVSGSTPIDLLAISTEGWLG
jgi:hypothetical protein